MTSYFSPEGLNLNSSKFDEIKKSYRFVDLCNCRDDVTAESGECCYWKYFESSSSFSCVVFCVVLLWFCYSVLKSLEEICSLSERISPSTPSPSVKLNFHEDRNCLFCFSLYGWLRFATIVLSTSCWVVSDDRRILNTGYIRRDNYVNFIKLRLKWFTSLEKHFALDWIDCSLIFQSLLKILGRSQKRYVGLVKIIRTNRLKDTNSSLSSITRGV